MRQLPQLVRCWVVLCLGSVGAVEAVVITVSDSGSGCEYRSGLPITLPAASLSTNSFDVGVRIIRDRKHLVRKAMFDASGRLMGGIITPATNQSLSIGNDAGTSVSSFLIEGGTSVQVSPSNQFPSYLVGQPYVWWLQCTRRYTNYACVVKVDEPVTAYLLVDNRVNDYLPDSNHDDPGFGPPDTQWILADGWQRVNTGLTPRLDPTHRGDYVAVDEGDNGTINEFYAVYYRTLTQPGSITLRTQYDGNFYCLVISTNPPVRTVHTRGLTRPLSAGNRSSSSPGSAVGGLGD